MRKWGFHSLLLRIMSTKTQKKLSPDAIARAELKVRVLRWTNDLCVALEEQYIRYSLNSARRSYNSSPSDYLRARIEDLEDGKSTMEFRITTGRKYHKIIQYDRGRAGSVHAFVDKNTGEVYKPASWASPAKHVRYDMRIINQREAMYANCDWAGGYLYLRG